MLTSNLASGARTRFMYIARARGVHRAHKAMYVTQYMVRGHMQIARDFSPFCLSVNDLWNRSGVKQPKHLNLENGAHNLDKSARNLDFSPVTSTSQT